MVMWGLLLGLGCTGDPAPDAAATVADARHYAEAARTGDAAACAAIQAPALAAECTALLARERAQAGDIEAALALCDAQPMGGWRDECFFLTADVSLVSGDAAKRACAQAGRFRNQCVGHAIAREAAVILGGLVPGEELAVLQALDAALAGYIASPPDRTRRVQKMVTDALAGREMGAPFSRALCGTAPDPVCQAAYVERLRRSEDAAGQPDGGWRRACPTPSAERAASLGLPTWTADFSGLARAAWESLCRQPRPGSTPR